MSRPSLTCPAPASSADLGAAAPRLGVPVCCPCRFTDWPQAPAGLVVAGLRLDRAGQRWPQTLAGL
ncbi:hypothetical protein CWE27_27600 [Streptomyces sp. EAG2]|nr:hypothetical protein CWE27_27600 [Streptomyces sp. EAG2]